MTESALSGKVVAITGASSGIGEATALHFAKEGAHVALAARRADRIDDLAKQIEADGGTAIAIETDVTDEASANAFVTQTNEQLGRLDVLVNNAGVMLLGPVTNADTGEWRRMIDVNILGLLYCTHAALPIMAAQNSGHVINVSSVAGRAATMGAAVYNFTKFGVCGFSEALRQEALNFNTRVTIIEPGAVETELLSHNQDYIKEIAAKRLSDITWLAPDDIARAIVYAAAQPEHVSINEVLVRPTRQK